MRVNQKSYTISQRFSSAWTRLSSSTYQLCLIRMDSRGHNYVRDHMPKIGLGTYLIKDENELRRAIDSALKYGYRFVDTAQVYRNEAMVGRALLDFMPKYGLTRLWWVCKDAIWYLGIEYLSLLN